MVTAYVALGSNRAYQTHTPQQLVNKAVQFINDLPKTKVTAQSSWYKSQAVVLPDAPPGDDYINGVVQVSTGLSAWQLLVQLQTIETQLGRNRDKETRWGARTLDLDILLYGQQSIHADSLKIPHPELVNRGFVLYPLADIDSQLKVPKAGCVSTLIEQLDENLNVERVV